MKSITIDGKYNINYLGSIANWDADPAVRIAPKNCSFNSVIDLVARASLAPHGHKKFDQSIVEDIVTGSSQLLQFTSDV